jgi:D-serine deaminase-like pyridoxal phosphate-dependent protein
MTVNLLRSHDHMLDCISLQTPCLLLDEAKLHRNVARMRGHLGALGVSFRPHLKTAKSIDVARLVMTTPQGPAMVSTLREAEYFAEGGLHDILYGVSIAPDKLPRVAKIRAGGVNLAIILDSIEQADAIVEYVATNRDPDLY